MESCGLYIDNSMRSIRNTSLRENLSGNLGYYVMYNVAKFIIDSNEVVIDEWLEN